jgi:hypothetical protein
MRGMGQISPSQRGMAEVCEGTRGIAIVCSIEGTLRRIIWDDVGVSACARCGEHFAGLVRQADARRVGEFLERARSGEIVIGYDFALRLPDRGVRCRFSGCRIGSRGLLLVGPTRGSRLIRPLEQMLRVGAARAASLRALLADSQSRLRGAAERNRALFDEMLLLRDEIARFRQGDPKAGAPARSRGGEGRIGADRADDVRAPPSSSTSGGEPWRLRPAAPRSGARRGRVGRTEALPGGPG